MANDPFTVKGQITVQDSATVLLVRRRTSNPTAATTISPFQVGLSPNTGIFGHAVKISFECDWEILLGQAEVINWLKTTPSKFKSMRYGGEWKLAGGNVDQGETIARAAARELEEEFLAPLELSLPSNAVLRPFVTKQTRPIRSRSNLMHCFVALEDENPWLRNLDIQAINKGLAQRRKNFAELSLNPDGSIKTSFYQRPHTERESVTPEVRQVQWKSLREGVRDALSSMSPNTIFVNAYQQEAFRKYNKTRRDPMFITAAILMELERFPDSLAVIEYCNSVNSKALAKEEQWLFSGMNAEEVVEAFSKRLKNGTNPSFKNPDHIAELRNATKRRRKQSKL